MTTSVIKEWRGKYANIDPELQLLLIGEAYRHLETAYLAISRASYLLWLLGKEEASRELAQATSYTVQAKIKVRRMRRESREVGALEQAEKEQGEEGGTQ